MNNDAEIFSTFVKAKLMTTCLTGTPENTFCFKLTLLANDAGFIKMYVRLGPFLQVPFQIISYYFIPNKYIPLLFTSHDNYFQRLKNFMQIKVTFKIGNFLTE